MKELPACAATCTISSTRSRHDRPRSHQELSNETGFNTPCRSSFSPTQLQGAAGPPEASMTCTQLLLSQLAVTQDIQRAEHLPRQHHCRDPAHETDFKPLKAFLITTLKGAKCFLPKQAPPTSLKGVKCSLPPQCTGRPSPGSESQSSPWHN